MNKMIATRISRPRKDEITCWLLDTRTLWPGDKIERAVSETGVLGGNDIDSQ